VIAVNIMDINSPVLGYGDSLERASEVFSVSGEVSLPVLKDEGLLVGVLSRKSLIASPEGEAGEVGGAEGTKPAPLVAGEPCAKAFVSAAPGATFFELKKMLPGTGGLVYIVDNAGRFLGLVGEAELARRAAEYGDRS